METDMEKERKGGARRRKHIFRSFGFFSVFCLMHNVRRRFTQGGIYGSRTWAQFQLDF